MDRSPGSRLGMLCDAATLKGRDDLGVCQVIMPAQKLGSGLQYSTL